MIKESTSTTSALAPLQVDLHSLLPVLVDCFDRIIPAPWVARIVVEEEVMLVVAGPS